MSSPLMPLIDSLQAEIFWHKSQHDSALKYIHAMMRSDYFDRSRSYLDLIDIYQKKGDIPAFRNYAYIFLTRYPFHDTAESVYDNLLSTYEGKIEITEIRALFKYLFTTKQFLASEKLLKLQSDYGQSNYEKDYFNWIPVEISFRQGEYKRVLDWCLTKRGYYKTPSILRSIDLHIARCYLRMGDVGRSIKAYQKFQKKYPKDKLSPEVLWKIAWLYEENFDLNNAIKTYQKLVRIYRRSSFYSEAYFRIGLDYYRLKKYKDARNSWQKAYNRTRDRFQRDRILYWIGKCYEKEKQYQKQGEIYIDLASRPLNSFYNLKAFYLTTDGQDTHQRINESLWELHQHNRSQLPRYISNFQRALLVEDILGSDWGDRELRAANAKSKDWQELYAIGELYERMENFGYAYRKFRNVYNKHFTRSSIPEMAPVFKKLYPMYFTAIVDSAAEQFSIPPELILSVIKKESAFEPKIISYANAYGLMQLLPGTASQIAPKLRLRFTSTDQLFQPEVNIQMGSYYLSSLLKRYRGNYVMALAGYNAGPHRVDRWKRSYPTYDDDLFMENLEFEQTRVYVRVCMKFFWIYRAIMNPGDVPEEIVNYPIKISEFL
jgi:soluble lytic murein transglycosylase-like protein